MARKARLKDHHATRPRPQIAAQPRPNWLVLALSLLGMALTAYLTWAASSGSNLQGCGIDSGCDEVLTLTRLAELTNFQPPATPTARP